MRTYHGKQFSHWFGEGFYWLHRDGRYYKSFKKMLLSFLDPRYTYILEEDTIVTGGDSAQFIEDTFNAQLRAMVQEETVQDG